MGGLMDGQIYLDDLEPGVRLTREDGSEFTQPRRTEAWICTEPLCGCTEVRLPIILATPGNAEDPASCELFLDLESRVLAKAETRHLGGSLQGLPERLAAKLVPPDWDRLRNWFIGQKEAQLREADPASLEAEFPAALELDPSLLVSYGVMVPCARPLLFTLGGMTWQARDEYCVCPPCTCEEVLLTFKSWPGEVPWGPAVHEDLGDGPTVRLSLVEPRWESVEAAGAGMPGLESLVGAMEMAWPDLRALLGARRSQMRRMAAASPIVNPPWASRVPVRAAKVGRNEPCPCGSGKKYKRCCLILPGPPTLANPIS